MPRRRRRPRRTREPCCTRCAAPPRCVSACWACTGGTRSRAGRGVRRGLAERSDELLAVVLERSDDRDEERHLPVLERVHDLSVSPTDLEDALTVGDELDLGQMLVELRALVQEI